MRYYSNSNLKAWNSVSLICILIMFLLSSCALFTACDSNCNGLDNCNNSGTTGTAQQPVTTSQSNTVNCPGYVQTGVGNTASYSITVNQGCDVIIQAVAGQNVGPYNWNNGAVAALGPGSYSFTLQDGSYQMTSDANAHAAFCNAVNWIQTNGKALSETYPLSGWGSC